MAETRESELFEYIARSAIFLTTIVPGAMGYLNNPESGMNRTARMAIALKKPVVMLFDQRASPEERQQAHSFFSQTKIILELEVDTKNPEQSWEQFRVKLKETLERLAKEHGHDFLKD